MFFFSPSYHLLPHSLHAASHVDKLAFSMGGTEPFECWVRQSVLVFECVCVQVCAGVCGACW